MQYKSAIESQICNNFIKKENGPQTKGHDTKLKLWNSPNCISATKGILENTQKLKTFKDKIPRSPQTPKPDILQPIRGNVCRGWQWQALQPEAEGKNWTTQKVRKMNLKALMMEKTKQGAILVSKSETRQTLAVSSLLWGNEIKMETFLLVWLFLQVGEILMVQNPQRMVVVVVFQKGC